MALKEVDANLFLSSTLSSIADLTAADNSTLVVQISEESIRRGVATGHNADRMVDLLSQLINRALHPGMLTRVRGWAGAYQPVGIGTVAYVETPDSEMMIDLRGDRELSEGFIAQLSPTTAIVRPEAVERFRQALSTRAIAVKALNRSPAETAAD